MNGEDRSQNSNTPPPIYMVSGGVGASSEQLVHTVLAQFPDQQVPTMTTWHVRRMEQIEDVVHQAASRGGMIVHTLVDAKLHDGLVQLAQAQNVPTIDLAGGLLSWLSQALGQEPLRQPGLYRRLNRAYFERIAAIDFAIAHDDGKRSRDWDQADVVLVGVSRAGKTPLSMYLAVLGWKVANLPLVTELTPPANLFELDNRRVIGLNIEPGQLVAHRRQRQGRLNTPAVSAYTDPLTIYEEAEAARRLFRKGGFKVIDITDKPIEAAADEVIKLVTRHFRNHAQDE